MWKDMDYYCQRDNDSAIGDSANNSAEEESLNSRRKSEVSDDASDTSVDTNSHLHSKFGMKVPSCLLKDGERNTDNNQAKAERKTSFGNTAARNGKSSSKRHGNNKGANKDDLQLQLQFLLGEMRSLRELDRDILRKFVNLNDCIEEVRWRLAENEAKFQRKLAEDDADEDFFSTLTETRLGDWEETDVTSPKDGSNVTRPLLRRISSNSITSPTKTTSVQSSKASLPPNFSRIKAEKISQDSSITSSFDASKQSYRNKSSVVDHSTKNTDNKQESSENIASKTESPVRLEKVSDDNYYRFKSPHSTPSDVWVAREKIRSQNQLSRRSSAKEPNSTNRSEANKPVRSASVLAKKYNDLIEQKTNKSTPTPDSTKTTRRVQWPVVEQRGLVKVSEFQKQREYQNLIGLSRVRGMGQIFTPADKKSTTSGSLSSQSSTPVLSRVASNRVGGSNRLKQRDVTSSPRTASSFRNNNNNNNNNLMIINSYCKQSSLSQNVDVVAAMSRQSASSRSIFGWIRPQDDVASYS